MSDGIGPGLIGDERLYGVGCDSGQVAASESVVAIAERLGHDNATLVLSTYGHLLPDMEDRTRRAVDDA